MMNEEILEGKINKILADNCGYNNVKDWLMGMGLGQYYDLFIENGYDSFKICSEIQKIDIETVGIHDDFHKNILIKGVKRMNNPKAESVYHRLSVSTPDDNEFRSLVSELNLSPTTEPDYPLPNGHTPRLTEDFYKKRPTLAEKRTVRSKLVKLKIDLTDAKYEVNSPELDTLAELIGSQLEIEELSVYDILCLLRGMAINNTSPKPTRHKLVCKPEYSSIETPTTPESPEDVFSSVNSEMGQPKPHVRPKKPPRAFTNPEEKPLLTPLVNGNITSPPTSITTQDTVDWVTTSTYDILHSDTVEPQVMSNVKLSNKLEDTPLPPRPVTPPTILTEEALYIDLDGSVITENSIGTTVKHKSISNSIFKRSKINSKKQTDDSAANMLKKPPNQPPPPPPVSTLSESESSAKSKSDKPNKEDNKTENTDVTTVTEPKGKKQSGFFKRNVKPKTETKSRNKKSKDESDLVSSVKEFNEESRRPLSKIISKSTDDLASAVSKEQCPNGELNAVSGDRTKQHGFSLLSQEANEELQRKKLFSASDQATKLGPTEEEDSSSRSLPPNPIPRRRNSPEETPIPTNNPKSPQLDQLSREELSKYMHTMPRIQNPESKAHPPPKKPKRNISEELIYNNIELPIPNPAPRARKIDSPPLANKDLPPMVLPKRSFTIASRSQAKLCIDTKQSPKEMPATVNQVRLKPEVPKGKKPALKTKPAFEGTVNKRDKSVSDSSLGNQAQLRINQSRSEDKLLTLFVAPSGVRTNSPLTAPPPPSTKRPGTPSGSNQAPEPPPIHLIPTMRPVAHVRPTKPPIITPPSAPNPSGEFRNADSWRKIEEKVCAILKEEDFIFYLVTHYTRENGESCITPGLVCRLANETSFAIHHITFALDNIRIQKLAELGKIAIPISLAEFDELLVPTRIDTISSWLTEIGLPNYIEVFEENVNNAAELKNLDADDLSEFCISTKHRGYLLHAIEMLH